MKIIKPIAMTDAILTSSTIAENDYSAWSDVTDYTAGDYVISTATHTVYRCLVSHTVGVEGPQDPDDEQTALADPLIADPSPQYWQVISATNRWKAFDQKPSAQASDSNSITYVFAPGEVIGGIALFNVSADEVTIQMNDPTEGVVYNTTVDLVDGSLIDDWFEYFFAPFTNLSEFVKTDLPPYSSASLTVTITNTGDTAAVGQIAFGPMSEIGYVELGASGFSGLDFSTAELDTFGNLTAVVRAATRLAEYDVVCETGNMLAIDRLLRDLRGGQAAVWIGDDDSRKAALAYGFHRTYRTIYQEGDLSVLNIQVQGLV